MSFPPACFGKVWIDDILVTITAATAFIVVSILGLIAHKFISRKKDLPRSLLVLFYTAVTSSCVCSMGAFCQNTLCVIAGYNFKWSMVFMSFVGYCVLLQCVLGIFLVRLNLTFNKSNLQLTLSKKCMMASLFVVMQVCFAAAFVMTAHFVFVSQRYVHSL